MGKLVHSEHNHGPGRDPDRMDMPKQSWARQTQPEIDFILSAIDMTPDSHILDIGCGQGRHTIELANVAL